MNRRAFQGVWTVIRFNWHLHAIAIFAIVLLALTAWFLGGHASLLPAVFALGAALTLLSSLCATWLAYDASGIYRMDWLKPHIGKCASAANIHAGFDETTTLLVSTFPDTTWRVFDFYQPEKHTELSIRRARKANPPSPGTVTIETQHIPLADGALDGVVLFLAAHEIRDPLERAGFFRELKRVLSENGRIVVTEHLRDLANIAAYSIGAWHFHTRHEWLTAFRSAGLRVDREFRNNPFITTFVLASDESAH